MWITLILVTLACFLPATLGKWAGQAGANGNRSPANVRYSLDVIFDPLVAYGRTIADDVAAAANDRDDFKTNHRLCVYMYDGKVYAAPTAAANRLLRVYKVAYAANNNGFRIMPVSVVMLQAEPDAFDNVHENNAEIDILPL